MKSRGLMGITEERKKATQVILLIITAMLMMRITKIVFLNTTSVFIWTCVDYVLAIFSLFL